MVISYSHISNFNYIYFYIYFYFYFLDFISTKVILLIPVKC
jgi:hypothetical protein